MMRLVIHAARWERVTERGNKQQVELSQQVDDKNKLSKLGGAKMSLLAAAFAINKTS